MFAEDLDQIVLADVQRDGHDLGLGDGHIVDPQLAQRVEGRWLAVGGGGPPRRASVRAGLKAERSRPKKPASPGSEGGFSRSSCNALLALRRPVGATAHGSFVRNAPVRGCAPQYGSERPRLQVSAPPAPPSARRLRPRHGRSPEDAARPCTIRCVTCASIGLPCLPPRRAGVPGDGDVAQAFGVSASPGSGGSGASPTNSAARSSDGQDSTLVGVGLPRKSAFSTAIRASSQPIRLIWNPREADQALPSARSGAFGRGSSPKASQRVSSMTVSTRSMPRPCAALGEAPSSRPALLLGRWGASARGMDLEMPRGAYPVEGETKGRVEQPRYCFTGRSPLASSAS
jgi:hypothetical protein